MNIHDLIIVGSGPAGLTAVIYAARANLKPLLIEGKKPGGQLMNTTYVENWPGEQSILGPDLMMKMKAHAKKFNTQFLAEEVVRVDFSSKPFTLWTHRDKELKARCVIIATGAVPKKLGIVGEEEHWAKGVSTCAVCDGAFYAGKRVIIVGGGDTAMEDASFMTKFTDNITIVQIMDSLTASHAMQERVLNNPSIKVIYSSALEEIIGDGIHVNQVKIRNKKTDQVSLIDTDAVFIAIGLNPNTKPFQGQLELDKYGYIQVHDHTRTSVEGIFVAGDAADYRYRQAVTSAGSGCQAALDAERYLSHHN